VQIFKLLILNMMKLRHVKNELFVTCAHGSEKMLLQELNNMGFSKHTLWGTRGIQLQSIKWILQVVIDHIYVQDWDQVQ
jgi:hypothetical protein